MPRSTLSRTVIHEADRQLRRTALRFGEEFRALRLRARLTQAAVARVIGVDRSVICRMEAGDPSVGDAIRARAAVAIGAELRLAVYPGATPALHDAAQARIVEALLAARHPRWSATVEAPIPGPGRRSGDVLLDDGLDAVLTEVEMRVDRWEEVVREGHAKREALRAVLPTRRVWFALVVPDTRHHRAILAAHPEMIRAAFPADPFVATAALTGPEQRWPGDALILVTRHGALLPERDAAGTAVRSGAVARAGGPVRSGVVVR